MPENTDAEKVDFNELKSGGFIKQNQKDLFTVRLRVPGGRLDIDRMAKIAVVAKKYSRMGYCHLSVRQSVEIIGVHIDDFDALVKELEGVFGSEYGVYINLLTRMRNIAMSDVKDDSKRKKILQRLAEKDILEIVKTKGTEEAEAKMREIIFQ